MIPALEHDFNFGIRVGAMQEILRRRASFGWSIATATEASDGTFTLFFTRQAPASPNTGEKQ